MRSEKEDKQAVLAKNVRVADMQQLLAKLEADLEVLDGQTPPAMRATEQNALDMKYLRERQMFLNLAFDFFVFWVFTACCY